LERPTFFFSGRALCFTFFFGLIMSARLWRKTLANRIDHVPCIDQSRSISCRPSTIKQRIIDITFVEVSLADDFRLEGSQYPAKTIRRQSTRFETGAATVAHRIFESERPARS
jgi:hypothetical protein